MTFNIFNKVHSPIAQLNEGQNLNTNKIERDKIKKGEKPIEEVAITILNSTDCSDSISDDNQVTRSNLAKRLNLDTHALGSSDKTIFPHSKRRKLNPVKSNTRELNYIKLGELYIPNLFLLRDDRKPISEESLLDCLNQNSFNIETLLILEKYARTYKYMNLTNRLIELVGPLLLIKSNQEWLIEQPLYLDSLELLNITTIFKLDWIFNKVPPEIFVQTLPLINLTCPGPNSFENIYLALQALLEGKGWNTGLENIIILFKYFERECVSQMVDEFVSLFQELIKWRLGLNSEESLTAKTQLALCSNFNKICQTELGDGEKIKFFEYFFYQGLIQYNYSNKTTINTLFTILNAVPAVKEETLFLYEDLNYELFPFCMNHAHLNLIHKRTEEKIGVQLQEFFTAFNPLNAFIKNKDAECFIFFCNKYPFLINQICNVEKIPPLEALLVDFVDPIEDLNNFSGDLSSYDFTYKIADSEFISIEPFLDYLLNLKFLIEEHNPSDLIKEEISEKIVLKTTLNCLTKLIFLTFCYPNHHRFVIKLIQDGVSLKGLPVGLVDLIFYEFLPDELDKNFEFNPMRLQDFEDNLILTKEFIVKNQLSNRLDSLIICNILCGFLTWGDVQKIQALVQNLDLNKRGEEQTNNLITGFFALELDPKVAQNLRFKEEVNLQLLLTVYCQFFRTPHLKPLLVYLGKLFPFKKLSPIHHEEFFEAFLLDVDNLDLFFNWIESGASFADPDVEGNKILHILVQSIDTTDSEDKFSKFLKIADLLSSEANHSFNNSGLSPLFIACSEWKNMDRIREFVKRVPNLNAKNSAGKNALHYYYNNYPLRNHLNRYKNLYSLFSSQILDLDNRGCFPCARPNSILILEACLLPQKVRKIKNQLHQGSFLADWVYIKASLLDSNNAGLEIGNFLPLLKVYCRFGCIEPTVRLARVIMHNNQMSKLANWDGFFYQALVYSEQNYPGFNKISSYFNFTCNLNTISQQIENCDIPIAPQNYFNLVEIPLENSVLDNFSAFYHKLEEHLESCKYRKKETLLSRLVSFYEKIQDHSFEEGSKLESSSSSLKSIFNLLINRLMAANNTPAWFAYSRLIADTSRFSCPIFLKKELCGYLKLLSNPALCDLLKIYNSNRENDTPITCLSNSYNLVQCFDRIMHHKPCTGTPKVSDITQITAEEQNSLDEFYKPIKNNFNHLIDLIYRSQNESQRVDYIRFILEALSFCVIRLSSELEQFIQAQIGKSQFEGFEQKVFSMLHSLKLTVINEICANMTVHESNHVISLIGKEIGLNLAVEDGTVDANELRNEKLKAEKLIIFFQNFHICRIVTELNHLINRLKGLEQEIMLLFLNRHIVPQFKKEKYNRLTEIANALDKNEEVDLQARHFFNKQIEGKSEKVSYSDFVRQTQTFEFYEALSADLYDKNLYREKQEILIQILGHFEIIHPLFLNLDQEYIKL